MIKIMRQCCRCFILVDIGKAHEDKEVYADLVYFVLLEIFTGCGRYQDACSAGQGLLKGVMVHFCKVLISTARFNP